MIFPTPMKQLLSFKLSRLLQDGQYIDEEMLLRAYTTFKLEELEEADRPRMNDIAIPLQRNEEYDNANRFFTSYGISDFILLFTHPFVANPYALAEFIDEGKMKMLLTTSKETTIESKNPKINSISIIYVISFIREKFQEEENSKSIYDLYKADASNRGLPFIAQQVFIKVAEMILLVRQDSAAEILGIKTYKALANHIGTLSNDYEFSREERRRLIVNGFTNKPIPVSMSAFSHKTDETVKKVINELEECVIGLPSPAKAVGIVDVLRKSKSNNTARMPNDISLEVSIVFNIFLSSSLAPTDINTEILIILPSIPFVLKWMEEKRLITRSTKFVLPSEATVKAFELEIALNKYEQKSENNTKFITYSQWVEEVRSKSSIKEKLILVFENRCNDFMKTGLEGIKLLASTMHTVCSEEATIYGISPEYSLRKTGTIINSFASDAGRKFCISDIIAIPRKGQNEDVQQMAASQTKKLVWRASSSNTSNFTNLLLLQNGKEIASKINQAGFYMKNNTRILAIENTKPIEFDLNNFMDSNLTLRQYIRSLNRPTAAIKENAKPIHFSKEITFWYTIAEGPYKTYRTKKKVTVSVRHILLQQNTDIGVNNTENNIRGPGKHRTIKGTKIDLYPEASIVYDTEALHDFILWKYPYYIVNRTPTGATSRGNEKPIRKYISDAYKEEITGSEITLKTFLYINEDIDVRIFPPEDTETLAKTSSKGKRKKKEAKQIMKPVYLHDILAPIGDKFVRELEYDDFTSCLEDSQLLSDSSGLYLKSIKAIRNMLNHAMANAFCDTNVITEATKDDQALTSAMNRLRAALVKKHFTAKEFKSLYKKIISKLDGTNPEYLGVLIKLFTGLESHAICALEWSDFKKVTDYGFFQLHIYRQLPGNGMEPIPLESDSSIRCIPCSPLLGRILDEYAPRRGAAKQDGSSKQNEKRYILSWTKQSGAANPIKPPDLDKITRDLLNDEFGNKQTLFTLLSAEDGTGAEVDLSNYKGSIFRENIRYWTTMRCGFDIDEVAHILGNEKPTVLGRYYRDFNNDATQYMMYSKLARMDALLEYYNKPYAGLKSLDIPSDRTSDYEIKAESQTPLQLEISANSENPETITLSCYHGFSMFVSDSFTEKE